MEADDTPSQAKTAEVTVTDSKANSSSQELFDIKAILNKVNCPLSTEPDIPTKSSTEILSELFGAFNAEPPKIPEVVVKNEDTKEEKVAHRRSKKSKKKHRHRERRHRREKNKRHINSNENDKDNVPSESGSHRHRHKHNVDHKRRKLNDEGTATKMSTETSVVDSSKANTASDTQPVDWVPVKDAVSADKTAESDRPRPTGIVADPQPVPKQDKPPDKVQPAVSSEETAKVESTVPAVKEACQKPPVATPVTTIEHKPTHPVKFPSDKGRPTTGKIVIKNLKFSSVYEETVRQVEEQAKLKAEKYEEGEIPDSSPNPTASDHSVVAEEENHVVFGPVAINTEKPNCVTEEKPKTPECNTEEEKKKNEKSTSNHKHSHSHKTESKSNNCSREKQTKKTSSSSSSRSKSKRKRSRSKERDSRRQSKDRHRVSRDNSRSRSSVRHRKDRPRDSSRHRSRSRDSRHSRKRERSRDSTRHRRRRSNSRDNHRRGRTRSRSRHRSRSHSRSGSRIDKQKLLEIARKNAMALLKQGALPSSVTSQEKVVAIKAGGKSVAELTDFCKQLSKKEAMGQASSDSDGDDKRHSTDSDLERPFHHPFQIKERPSSIVLNIRNSVQLPVKTLQEKTAEQSKQLRIQFPVSSGQQHRKTENEWIPVSPKKDDQTASSLSDTKLASDTVHKGVFPSTSGLEGLDIGSIVSQRLTAMRKLQENPNDVQALTDMYQAQKNMQVWAESKQQPGQFTGSTGVRVLTAAELSSGFQAWAKKDQLKEATPVSGGMGMTLLQKMGWRPGEGLGKNKEGTLEPLQLEIKMDKKGLVSQEELARKPLLHHPPHQPHPQALLPTPHIPVAPKTLAAHERHTLLWTYTGSMRRALVSDTTGHAAPPLMMTDASRLFQANTPYPCLWSTAPNVAGVSHNLICASSAAQITGRTSSLRFV